MKKSLVNISLIIIFIALASIYYNYKIAGEIDKIFVTLSTFLFSIFIGFFISKQSGRYAEIRKFIADFDGTMSAIYRAMEHFGKDNQKKTGEIIESHYRIIIENGWDYPFIHKTTTITDLHKLTEEAIKKEGLNGIKGSVATRNMLGLQDLQKIRKNMVSLREERIPAFQWLLIIIIAIILIVTVSTVSSTGSLLISLIKSAFVSSVLVALILLRQLDSLELFFGKIGEHSAQDVINIIKGEK